MVKDFADNGGAECGQQDGSPKGVHDRGFRRGRKGKCGGHDISGFTECNSRQLVSQTFLDGLGKGGCVASRPTMRGEKTGLFTVQQSPAQRKLA